MSGCLTRRTRLLCPKEEDAAPDKASRRHDGGSRRSPDGHAAPSATNPECGRRPSFSPARGTSREPSTAAESFPNRVQRKSPAAVRSA